MTLSIKLSILVIATLLTGLSAGLCFTWTNTVTTGIGKLDNVGYLQAFQQMNRAIINPTFMIVFFGSFMLQVVNIFIFKNVPSSFLIHSITATVLYFLGVVLVTIFGNVPLNELLDKTDLAAANTAQLQNLRTHFEVEWNRLHLIRTITSILSFLLLLISLLKVNNLSST
ncbi:DUF1772 domain-containing protein [Kordia sp. YSTF-M3]|uniref:DUF1772 domain-containing protein n=1 Tax=Kordia aestuariivivens TaxID=2759037 RepID=A0ABR7Q5P2_9FLAO|nr:anthrone oxygenase family protein [Kordia aestuariivivens]MBC8753879.1 DUF1772 domain-containing protein [Kordia aestuariivivens]